MDIQSSKQTIQKSFDNSGEIEEISRRVSLRDPLSQMRIKTPVRGSDCKHVQCFDLEPYLLINFNDPKFKCPVCYKQAYYSQLIVDSYFEEILSNITDEDTEEVQLLPDATWKEEMRPKKRKGEYSDDEDEPDFKRQNTYSTPKMNMVIDLT